MLTFDRLISTCAISLIRLAYLKQGPDFTFDNVGTSCWSISELACGIICACLPTLRPLMTKIKPQWMTSYATKTRRQTYGVASGLVRSGADTLVKNDVKSSTGQRTRNTPESSLSLSSTNFTKNYSRLDDDDIEQAMRMPAPLSPAYRKTDSISSDSESIFGNAAARSAMDQEGVPMQQLPARPRQSHRASESGKAREILGMGFGGIGATTHVVGGGPSSPTSTNGEFLGGIEVKRDVFVVTTPISEGPEHRP